MRTRAKSLLFPLAAVVAVAGVAAAAPPPAQVQGSPSLVLVRITGLHVKSAPAGGPGLMNFDVDVENAGEQYQDLELHFAPGGGHDSSYPFRATVGKRTVAAIDPAGVQAACDGKSYEIWLTGGGSDVETAHKKAHVDASCSYAIKSDLQPRIATVQPSGPGPLTIGAARVGAYACKKPLEANVTAWNPTDRVTTGVLVRAHGFGQGTLGDTPLSLPAHGTGVVPLTTGPMHGIAGELHAKIEDPSNVMKGNVNPREVTYVIERSACTFGARFE